MELPLNVCDQSGSSAAGSASWLYATKRTVPSAEDSFRSDPVEINVAAIHSIAAPSNTLPNDSDNHPRSTVDHTAQPRRRSIAVGVAI
ncbi:hypothetical protein GCM10023321_72980 [Pseudonocardia eucalypti]|uniref:Uncharacterized protein n=1 Tax=Pseudonocardia eucalypti TaxID=648755 RepID=A0ABP9R7U7_9PSEU